LRFRESSVSAWPGTVAGGRGPAGRVLGLSPATSGTDVAELSSTDMEFVPKV